MCALATKGFELSALPRAPDVPSNIGKVDVQAIYEAVQRGLSVADAVRMGASRETLERTQNQLGTQQALAGMDVLPAQTEAARATSLASAQTAPLSVTEAQNRGTILASKADPRLLTATNAGDIAESDIKVGDAAFLNQPGMRQRKMDLMFAKMTPMDVRQRNYYLNVLDDPQASEDAKKAARIALKFEGGAAAGASTFHKVVDDTGAEYPASFDRNTGQFKILNPENAASSRAAAPAAGSIGLDGAAPAVVPAASAQFHSPTPGELEKQKSQAKADVELATAGSIEGAKSRADAEAKLSVERESKLPKAQSALFTMEDKTDDLMDSVSKAKALVSRFSVGYGSLLDRLPETDARALKAQLESIRANIGFDALQEMRMNSPTGGALGNVSDYEGKNLQAVIASLDTGVEPEQFLTALDKIVTTRARAIERLKAQYIRDFKLVDSVGGDRSELESAGSAKTPSFASEAEVEAAVKEKRIQPGDKIIVNGVEGTWQ